MLGLFKKLFGSTPKADFGALITAGATILDVRTPAECAGGHLKGSINIPLQSLKAQMSKIKKDKPVITVCASGMRSASARSLLMADGFAEVHNGGSWMSLKKFES